MSEQKKVLAKLLAAKQGRVPISFWHHFSAASGIDLDGFKHPEIISGNIASTKKYVEDIKPDFVKLMSDGLFNHEFNQDNRDTATNIYTGLKPIDDANLWLKKTHDLVAAQKKVIGDRLGFYNIFSPTTLLKWALTEDENGKHDKSKANGALADIIISDPENVKIALDAITEDVKKQIYAAISGGADGIYYSTQEIQDDRIDRDLFEKFVAENDKNIFEYANQFSNANILHICGGGGARNDLELFKDYDAPVVNWSTDLEKTPLEEGKKIFAGKVVLGGLGNTVSDVLYRGSEEDIEKEVDRVIKGAGTDNVIIGANCTVPRDIALENLRWGIEAAK